MVTVAEHHVCGGITCDPPSKYSAMVSDDKNKLESWSYYSSVMLTRIFPFLPAKEEVYRGAVRRGPHGERGSVSYPLRHYRYIMTNTHRNFWERWSMLHQKRKSEMSQFHVVCTVTVHMCVEYQVIVFTLAELTCAVFLHSFIAGNSNFTRRISVQVFGLPFYAFFFFFLRGERGGEGKS